MAKTIKPRIAARYRVETNVPLIKPEFLMKSDSLS
jgi:hypothetical protein